jgi:ferredoxin
MVNGRPSLEVDEKKCICCGACYPPCPPMQINDPEHSKFAIWVGGKNSNARTKPMFHKLVAAGIPNNPPRWPEVAAIVKKILRVYKEDAHDWERMGEWVERIGWPRFFELTELPFTKYHLDNRRGEIPRLLHLGRRLRMHEVADQLETCERQHQDDAEEDDRAVFEGLAAHRLDAIQNPVGGEVKPDSHEREVDDFHGIAPVL